MKLAIWNVFFIFTPFLTTKLQNCFYDFDSKFIKIHKKKVALQSKSMSLTRALLIFARQRIRQARAHTWDGRHLMLHPHAEQVIDSDAWFWMNGVWFRRETRAERDLRAGRYSVCDGISSVLQLIAPNADAILKNGDTTDTQIIIEQT
jgi:hypothetical protein